MPTWLVYLIIVPLVAFCFIASAFMIWDLWHIPTIYVDDGEA